MWEESDVQLVLVEWLKPHEEIKVKARDKLLDMTKRWGGYTKPLLVDMNTGAILDGHHRYSVARLLKLNIARNWREYLYYEHIKRITGPGNLIREHDGSGKEGIEVFLRNFESLVEEKNQEMIPNVPISNSLIPLDGSHRIAAAIVNKNKINCLKFQKNYNIESNYKFFLGNSHLHKSTPVDLIEESSIEYCRIKANICLYKVGF